MVNREHKDRLFKMIFGREEHREWTLSLYNAVNGTDYDDPSQIEFNTLEDGLYLGMKNDMSFILDDQLMIYGHQSTYNPNAPVRCLIYLGDLWSGLLYGRETNSIYGSRLIRLPAPRFVVFYNGTEKADEEIVLKLSEAFTEETRKKSDVELSVRMVNINSGYNMKLLDKCRPLYEYSWLIARIRENLKTMKIEEAVDRALDDMPENFLIRRFLMENRGAAHLSILTEYDEEKVKRTYKDEGREEGSEHRLIDQICKKLRKGKNVRQIADEVEEDETLVQKICDIAEAFAPEYETEKVFDSVQKKSPCKIVSNLS
ncbi:MAG: hypothetical protein IKI75_12770 [Lachnospiraceae bacterium]|nr:hypothetical protein [Lachnospiraceae bacterium]